MSLAPGSRVGTYHVTAKIGQGGMGEVYQATDSQLNRAVALKVLSDAFIGDPDRLARFEREAKVLAQLNHPNIAHVYGLEVQGETRALVMELVEGPTLDERIARGPLPLDESLAIAVQIAHALEAAHSQGIVHRDLKPANIKVRADGTVKVLDFGLAKALEPAIASGASATTSPTLMNSPTLTGVLGTQLGVILGSAAYMAPEQAAGKMVDRRADIWAFGVVLLEMLRGKRLFEGDSVAETLAGVLKSEIRFDQLPPEAPPELVRLLRRCLERQPRNRLHDVADARIVLEELADGKREVLEAAPRTVAPSLWRRAAPWALAALGVGFGLFFFLRAKTDARQMEAPLLRFSIAPPGHGEVEGYPALSPDGRALAFCFVPEHGVGSIWLHSFATGRSLALDGTDFAEQIFWSPDSRYVAFFAAGKLKRVEVTSGHVEPLTAASDARGGTWSESGDIYYSATCCGPLSVLPAAGAARRFTQFDSVNGETSHRFPWALPGGRAMLFVVADGKRPGLYWMDLKTQKRVFLQAEVARPLFDPRGYLLWRRDQALVGQRFDPQKGALSGEAFVITDNIGSDPDKVGQDLVAAAPGVIAVRPVFGHQRELRWFDRRGVPGDAVASAGNFYEPSLSPDGKRIAVAKGDQPNYFTSDIWVYDAAAQDRGSRVSFGVGIAPHWSGDSSTIYFITSSEGSRRLMAKRADGTAGEQELMRTPYGLWASDSSLTTPLMALEGGAGEGYKIWLLPLNGHPVLQPFMAATPGSQAHGAFSPDGRLIAYASDESGLSQIFVQALNGSGRWQVTSNGGDLPRWRRDGKELYYVGFDRVLRAVAVTSLAPFTTGETQPLFSLRIPTLAITSVATYYAPSADGQRFLVNSRLGAAGEPGVDVLMNWSPPANAPPAP